jgi:hypothetical protein
MTNDAPPGVWSWILLVAAAGLTFVNSFITAKRRESVEDARDKKRELDALKDEVADFKAERERIKLEMGLLKGYLRLLLAKLDVAAPVDW